MLFGERHAGADLAAGGDLLVGRVAVVAEEVEAVEIAPVEVEADRDVAVEQIGLGEAELDRLGIARIIDRGAQLLAAAHEVALLDRQVDEEALEARKAGRQLELAGRPLLDLDAEHDPVGRRALLLLDLQILLEEAERLDAVARAADADVVERIALGEAELAADHLVAGGGVAGDVDPLDIDARRLGDPEGDPHGEVLAAAVELRAARRRRHSRTGRPARSAG